MNIVKFWEDQVAKYDAEQKCGFCWDFGAPLREDKVNIEQPNEGKECCVKVMFLQDKGSAFNVQRSYNQQTALMNGVTTTYNFQLLVVLDSVLGINMYDETKGHDKADSIWTTILSRLQNCLADDLNFDFCLFLGSVYQVTQWSATQEINYLNSNYCGYRINVTFSQRR